MSGVLVAAQLARNLIKDTPGECPSSMGAAEPSEPPSAKRRVALESEVIHLFVWGFGLGTLCALHGMRI